MLEESNPVKLETCHGTVTLPSIVSVPWLRKYTKISLDILLVGMNAFVRAGRDWILDPESGQGLDLSVDGCWCRNAAAGAIQDELIRTYPPSPPARTSILPRDGTRRPRFFWGHCRNFWQIVVLTFFVAAVRHEVGRWGAAAEILQLGLEVLQVEGEQGAALSRKPIACGRLTSRWRQGRRSEPETAGWRRQLKLKNLFLK